MASGTMLLAVILCVYVKFRFPGPRVCPSTVLTSATGRGVAR